MNAMLRALSLVSFIFFFFNDTATTEIYTLSLHDALPIFHGASFREPKSAVRSGIQIRLRSGSSTAAPGKSADRPCSVDRKSTRLNSSHANISYAVFCLKKKKKQITKIFDTNTRCIPYSHI